MPDRKPLSSKPSALALTRRFQQLFSQLDHSQIGERLVQLVIAKPAISRVLLVLIRQGKLYVEAIATAGPEPLVRSLGSELKHLSYLPHNAIEAQFTHPEARSIDSHELASLGVNASQKGALGAYLQPIVIDDHCQALFYLETQAGTAALERSLQELDSLWLFSSLLVSQLQEGWELAQQRQRQHLAEQALWASEAYLNALLQHSPTLISVKDLDGNLVLVSDRFRLLANQAQGQFGGKNLFDIFPRDTAQAMWDMDLAAKTNQQTYEIELELMHADGSLHTYLLVKFALRNNEGQVFGICTIGTDISERKLAEKALREQQSRLNYMAFHDALTALPNRSLFYDRIYHGLARARRSQTRLALILLDIDRFKVLNDSLGHDAGDILLKEMAQRLTEGVRDMDTVARLGGDEFVVVLESVDSNADVEQIACKLLHSLGQPVAISGHSIRTTASMGICLFPDDGQDTDELLKNADIAMYQAKEAGKNTFQFYTRGMNATTVNYLLLENDLRHAIENKQLTLHYQPQIDLKTGDLTGVEALVRWQHPERGLVSPANFIPLAEETGMIVPLGEWVLREACRQKKKWLDSGKSVGKVAVNLSPRQFRQKNFPEKVEAILRETGLEAKYLELEITESCAMEHAGETINQLKQLNQMGTHLAIDDFGTGYSSLAYLQRFPIQKLKIDRSFIHDIHDDANDAAIAKTIIGLAHSMQLRVVAEGVETERQAEWLRNKGCDQVQGFLYAKPMSASQLESHFHNGRFNFDGTVVSLESRLKRGG